MTKDIFFRLVEAREGLDCVMGLLRQITGDHPDGIMAVIHDDINDVISVYSKYEFDHLRQNERGLNGDRAYIQADEILRDETLTTKQKCDILYDLAR